MPPVIATASGRVTSWLRRSLRRRRRRAWRPVPRRPERRPRAQLRPPRRTPRRCRAEPPRAPDRPPARESLRARLPARPRRRAHSAGRCRGGGRILRRLRIDRAGDDVREDVLRQVELRRRSLLAGTRLGGRSALDALQREREAAALGVDLEDQDVTVSPCATTSRGFSTWCCASSEMWTRPSTPGRISTKAPNVTTFVTRPSTTSPSP